jgi:hypothetical protein
MKWEEKQEEMTSTRLPLERLSDALTRLEPYFVHAISSSPVYSRDERRKMIERYRELRSTCVDGVSRLNKAESLKEEYEPEKQDFQMKDDTLSIRLGATASDIQYFASLGLNAIERLYLTNHLPEVTYFKYRRVLRFLPKFQQDIKNRVDQSDE